MEPREVVEHSSSQFTSFLKSTHDRTMEMGGLVEQHVASALQAFMEGDQKLAKRIARADFEVNALEVKIDEECTEFLALQHPVAKDLRTVMAMTRIVMDLERVGDESEKIARLALKMDYDALQKRHLHSIKHIGRHVLDMFRKAMDACARLDTVMALEVLKTDIEVDQEYEASIRQLITFMMEDPHEIRQALEVLWCAKALERIGDHSANICEHVLFQVLGKDLRHISIDQVQRELEEVPPSGG